MESDFMKRYFQQADNLECYTWKDNNEWLKLRRPYIGGSEIGIVLGLNKYRSKLSLYKEKAEGIVTDVSDSVFVRKGKDLEALIREYYVRPYLKEKGYSLQHFDFMLVNKLYPQLSGNLDGYAEYSDGELNYKPENNMVVEIKWVSRYGEDNWNNEDYYGVPPSYYAQVQQYMLITGCKKAIICALFDKDWSMHYYEIPRDDMFLTNLIKKAIEFFNYITFKIAPPMDSKLDSDALFEAANVPNYNDTSPYGLRVESEEMAAAVEKYLTLTTSIKNLEVDKKECLDFIINEYNDNKKLPLDNPHYVLITPVVSRRFDTTKFKEDHPDLYKEYCKEVSSVKTTIK